MATQPTSAPTRPEPKLQPEDLGPNPFLGGRPIPNQPDLEQPPSPNRRRPKRDTPQVLPHDLGAERALLGAALLGADDTLHRVPHGAFYGHGHDTIADTIRALHNEGAYIDTVTVADRLTRGGLLNAVGGTPTLATLMGETPSVTGADTYARIVLGHHQARQIIHAAEAATQTAATEGPGPALIKLRTALDQLTPLGAVDTDDPDLDTFLDQTDTDYDWLVPGLLEHRDRVILTAVEGTGKSTLLRQMAVQFASGIDPFTHQRIDPFQVLLVDCENSPRQARRALQGLRETAGDAYTSGRLRLRVLGEAMALANPAVEADLAARIIDQAADIVIIGPLYKMVTGDPIKEEPAKAVADAIDRLRNIRGSAFLIEAHSPYAEGSGKNRPIRPYGASLWSRWPEFGIHLADDGHLKHWRGQREGRAWPTKLEHAQPWPWAPADDDTPAWDGPTECADAVVAFLEEAGGSFSVRQIETHLRERGRGYRTKTVVDAARLAHQNDRIQCKTGSRGSLLYSALDPTQDPFEEF